MSEIEILKRAEKVQDETHRFVEAVMKAKPNISYQDATNMCFIRKIAELEFKIERYENKD